MMEISFGTSHSINTTNFSRFIPYDGPPAPKQSAIIGGHSMDQIPKDELRSSSKLKSTNILEPILCGAGDVDLLYLGKCNYEGNGMYN